VLGECFKLSGNYRALQRIDRSENENLDDVALEMGLDDVGDGGDALDTKGLTG
jgi:hypothetical protein